MSNTNQAGEPRHPGRILYEEFLVPAGVKQSEFATHIGMAAPSLSLLITGKRAVTPNTAWKLGMALGTGPGFWLDRQAEYDLWQHRPKSHIARHLRFLTEDSPNRATRGSTKHRTSRPERESDNGR